MQALVVWSRRCCDLLHFLPVARVPKRRFGARPKVHGTTEHHGFPNDFHVGNRVCRILGASYRTVRRQQVIIAALLAVASSCGSASDLSLFFSILVPNHNCTTCMRDEGHVYTIVPYCSSSCQKILGVVISATNSSGHCAQ